MHSIVKEWEQLKWGNMKILYCIPSLSESGGTERIVTQKSIFTNLSSMTLQL